MFLSVILEGCFYTLFLHSLQSKYWVIFLHEKWKNTKKITETDKKPRKGGRKIKVRNINGETKKRKRQKICRK